VQSPAAAAAAVAAAELLTSASSLFGGRAYSRRGETRETAAGRTASSADSISAPRRTQRNNKSELRRVRAGGRTHAGRHFANDYLPGLAAGAQPQPPPNRVSTRADLFCRSIVSLSRASLRNVTQRPLRLYVLPPLVRYISVSVSGVVRSHGPAAGTDG